MISRFSVEVARRELEGDVGYAFDLESPFGEARAVGGLATSAHAFINSAIKCYIVGLVTPGSQLAKKSVQWIESAIELDERPSRYFANGTEAGRLYDLALSRWLCEAVHDEESLAASVDYRERYFAGPAGRDCAEVAFVLPEYLDAGEYELARKHVERLWKDRKRPQDVEAAYCLAETQGSRSDTQESKIDALFRRRLHDWLTRGHFDTVAKWLKVTSWNLDQRRTPVDVLSVAHKYL